MRWHTLLFHNLFFHWRANLAVLLGTIVGTAVLSGALLVGDSLRGSLRDLALRRLGAVDFALVGDRFFPADFSERMTKADSNLHRVVPVIMLRGVVLKRNASGDVEGRAGKVHVVGVDSAFWPLFGNQRGDLGNDLLLNEPLAKQLGVTKGDLLEVRFDKPQTVPSDSVLGRRADANALTIEASPIGDVLPPRGAGEFSLGSGQQTPLIVYVALERLQRRLHESTQVAQAANAILVSASETAKPQAALERVITLEDVGLRLRPDAGGRRRYLSLESRRMLIENNVVASTLDLAAQNGWQARPTTTYLANRISVTGGDRFTPYSTVTALDPSEPPPWGPFELLNGKPAPKLYEDAKTQKILLIDWLAADLFPDGVPDRAKIDLSFFVEGDSYQLEERKETFTVAGVVKQTGPAADAMLTPDFPGIRGTRVQDWKPPFPKDQWHPEWVRPKDDEYWRQYKATPKAFIAPENASYFWSRHGRYTSIRIAPKNGQTLAELETDIRQQLGRQLPPSKLALEFRPVKELGLAASQSSTSEMFGWLFLGFSFFLIISAAMLVGLLFRLGVERRAKELGLLAAVGFRQRSIRRLLLLEGMFIAVVGSVIGLAVAVGYAWLLLEGMKRGWSDTLHTSFLSLHVAGREPMFGLLPYPSLTIGFVLGLGVSWVAILWALRGVTKLSPRALLAGQPVGEAGHGVMAISTRWPALLATLCLISGAGIAAVSFQLAANVAAPLFFGSGLLVLIGGISLLRWRMNSYRTTLVAGNGVGALLRFGVQSSRRNIGRSLLTVGLLASATFLVVAVESFRKSSGHNDLAPKSGTGGFPLVAESDLPLPFAPDTQENRKQLLADATSQYRNEFERQLMWIRIYSLRMKPGDDVSCLNLYQPTQPRILGVPLPFMTAASNRFTIDTPIPHSAKRGENPWLSLVAEAKPNVPVFADDHTAQWVLKKSIGDTWPIPDDRGQTDTLSLAGLVANSIFRSELLMGEEHFRKLFPNSGGFRFFLIDAPPEQADNVQRALEKAFGERYGFNVERTLDRLASFQAVENTYLSTFQMLGGLGLLLGSLGLAVVLLRNVWERQGELALLQALGFRRSAIAWLLLAENGFLVVIGLGIGILAAVIAVLPHLVGQGSPIHWPGILILIGLVLVVGLSAGGLALLSVFRTRLITALRRE